MDKKLVVLYLENQVNIRLMDLLQTHFTVVEASTAIDAHKHLKEVHFSGVILDIMLKAGDDSLKPQKLPSYLAGITILGKILKGDYNQYGNGADLPVIVVSAVALVEAKMKITDLLGSYAQERYFPKPANNYDIVNVLIKTLYEKGE